MKSIAIDLHGRRFVRLQVICRAAPEPRFDKRAAWHCLCDCGKTVDVIGKNLLTGNSKSCGCLRDETASLNNATHRLIHTRAYQAWGAAKTRCYNTRQRCYANYGGRGIIMCQEWRDSFEAFYADMGECPPGYSLERRNNNGPYAADNCYWATRLEQNNNTRTNVFLTFNGERLSVSAWTRRLGFKDSTIKRRLYRGWSVERALTTPVRH